MKMKAVLIFFKKLLADIYAYKNLIIVSFLMLYIVVCFFLLLIEPSAFPFMVSYCGCSLYICNKELLIKMLKEFRYTTLSNIMILSMATAFLYDVSIYKSETVVIFNEFFLILWLSQDMSFSHMLNLTKGEGFFSITVLYLIRRFLRLSILLLLLQEYLFLNKESSFFVYFVDFQKRLYLTRWFPGLASLVIALRAYDNDTIKDFMENNFFAFVEILVSFKKRWFPLA